MDIGQKTLLEVKAGLVSDFCLDEKGDIVVMKKTPGDFVRLVDFYAFVFCKKGTLWLNIDDEIYEVPNGSMVFIGQYSYVGKVKMSPDFEGMSICVSHSLLTRYFLRNKNMWMRLRYLQHHRLLHFSDECLEVQYHFYDIFSWLLRVKDQKVFYEQIVDGVFRGLLYSLLSKFEMQSQEGIYKIRESLIVRFINLVKEDEARNRNLSYYADELHVTTKYLSSVCSRTLGKTAHKIIEEETITMIKHYIFNTDLSVKQIAAEMNFCSLSFFGKYVRQHFGKSPLQLRAGKK